MPLANVANDLVAGRSISITLERPGAVVLPALSRTVQDREIDLAIIIPDRIVLVDLKNHLGRIESRDGVCFAYGYDLGPSVARKLRENAKVMASLLRSR